MAERYHISISDGKGQWLQCGFKLYTDPKTGAPAWSNRTQRVLGPALNQGEPSYANLVPDIVGVYAQPDLSAGAGQRVQVSKSDENARRYDYSSGLDASQAGQLIKGPGVASLSKGTTGVGVSQGSYWLANGKFHINTFKNIVQYSTATGAFSAVYTPSSGLWSVAKFYRSGTEALDQKSSHITTAFSFDNARTYYAQEVTPAASGFLSKVVAKMGRSSGASTVFAGDVYCAVQAPYNGLPSGDDLALAWLDQGSLSTVKSSAASTVSFNFPVYDRYFEVSGEKYWLVWNAIGATTAANAYIGFGTSAAASSYVGGGGAYSFDSGNSYTKYLDGTTGLDFWFETYNSPVKEAVYGGQVAGDMLYSTAANSSAWTTAGVAGLNLLSHGGWLFRDVPTTSNAVISYSMDGTNWDYSPVIVGNPKLKVTQIYGLNDAIIIATTEGIWAMEVPNGDTVPNIQQIYRCGRNTYTGRFGCVYQNALFLPNVDGRLVAIEGGWTSGFLVYTDIGPDAVPGWRNPWGGAGTIVAVAAGRHELYAIMTTASTYKLFKSYDPFNREWHGSIADLGSNASYTGAEVYEPGSSKSPALFFDKYVTSTGTNMGKVVLPRTLNPVADGNYRFSTAAQSIHFPRAHGNFHVTPKRWLSESVTFETKRAGAKASVYYDDLSGVGWVRAGELFDTGTIDYPADLMSVLLARKLEVESGSSTTTPVIAASGVSYNLVMAAELRELRFLVEADDKLSAKRLGDMLGVRGDTTSRLLRGELLKGGARTVKDWRGETYERVVFTAVNETLTGLTDGGGRTVLEVVGVMV